MTGPTETPALPAASDAAARFRRYAWAVLAYNIVVILFGAYVRASGSGAGCGAHWPLCNGEVVPRAPRIETIVEFTHRLTSGLALLSVAVLLVWAWRLFPKGHRARTAALATVVFMLLEAALGAGLVLFQYVAQNVSVGRAIYLSLHLVNTQLLLMSIVLAAALARLPERCLRWSTGYAVAAATLPLTLLVGISGAIAALGDTLFPVSSLSEGLRADFSSTAHILVRLRVLHPGLAVVIGAYILFAALSTVRSWPALKKPALLTGGLVLLQMAAGFVNVWLLAPVWMQIVHLLFADLLWIALVLLLVSAAEATSPAEDAGPHPRELLAAR